MATILTQVEDHILTIALNRPDVRNALNSEMMADVLTILADAEAAEEVRCVILTGNGSAFSAGADLDDLESMIEAPIEESRGESERYRNFFLSTYRFPKPTIAAVNGPAIAGGCGLATICDLVVAAENARFGYTEVRIGFVPALVSTFLLAICPEKKVNELLLTGRTISAREALELGLVNEVVGREETLSRARQLASLICQNSPSAVSSTKQLLRQIRGLGLEQATRLAAETNALARTNPDLKEGIRAFLEKRSPEWQQD